MHRVGNFNVKAEAVRPSNLKQKTVDCYYESYDNTIQTTTTTELGIPNFKWQVIPVWGLRCNSVAYAPK